MLRLARTSGLYRHRNNAVGQNGDELSTLYFRGNNDDGTQSQRPIDYAAIRAEIIDVSDTTEDGKLRKSRLKGTDDAV